MRWIKSWSASSEHSCGLDACFKQSRCSLTIYLYKGNLTLLDSHLLHCIHCIYLHVLLLCMTTCIQILLILLYLNNLPLNPTCTPVISKPECIIKQFSRLKSICQTFDHLNKLNKSCFNQCLSYSVSIRTVSYMSPANHCTCNDS